MPSTDRVEARACFREASQLNADDPRVWQALAKLAETPAESVEALRHLLRIAPNTPNAPVALRSALAADARELVEAKRLEEAYKRWREAADLAGGDCESWLGVAGTTTIQEEKERAIETAYKLNPSNEQAIAAMRKLQASKINPSKVAAPVDAFARFGATEESAEGELAGLEGDATLDALDATLDAFASLPDAPPEFEPVPEADVNPVQAIETAPESALMLAAFTLLLGGPIIAVLVVEPTVAERGDTAKRLWLKVGRRFALVGAVTAGVLILPGA